MHVNFSSVYIVTKTDNSKHIVVTVNNPVYTPTHSDFYLTGYVREVTSRTYPVKAKNGGIEIRL